MGKIRITYDVEFKKKAIDLYLKKGMCYKTLGIMLVWKTSSITLKQSIFIYTPSIKRMRSNLLCTNT